MRTECDEHDNRGCLKRAWDMGYNLGHDAGRSMKEYILAYLIYGGLFVGVVGRHVGVIKGGNILICRGDRKRPYVRVEFPRYTMVARFGYYEYI